MIKAKPDSETKPKKSRKASSDQGEKINAASSATVPAKYFPLTISVDEGLLARLDKEWHARGLKSRSETARTVLEKGLPK